MKTQIHIGVGHLPESKKLFFEVKKLPRDSAIIIDSGEVTFKAGAAQTTRVFFINFTERSFFVDSAGNRDQMNVRVDWENIAGEFRTIIVPIMPDDRCFPAQLESHN